MPASPCIELDGPARARLLGIARQAIRDGLRPAATPPARAGEDEPGGVLATPAAVFVTLTRQGELRGCVGSLEARDPLALAVARAARNAAFGDRRFAALRADELDSLQIEISVLSPMEALPAVTRAQLIDGLRPGVDGLLIEDGPRRSTFLPQVWEKIADPETFVSQLLIKAGLAADHWSPMLRAYRYGTLSFHENR